MILVLASIGDESADAFAHEFPADTAAVFTCFNLAGERSSLPHPAFSDSTITAGGRKIGVGEIEGVINLLPAVFPGELVFYAPEEREYQAAEFHALLVFFLSSLKCPVLNRPSRL